MLSTGGWRGRGVPSPLDEPRFAPERGVPSGLDEPKSAPEREGWLLTLPPPQSLDEPRIAPGGPPSLPLLELRRALQTHFGEPSQSSVRWHARFGAHEPVELDSERESMYTVLRARAGCAPSIHGTWKNTTPTKSMRLRIMRLIRKLP